MDLIAWWPDSFMIVSQIMIGASVGSKFNKAMFVGMRKILVVSSLSTVAFIFMMILCAYIDSRMTGMLREAISAYLKRTRRLDVPASEILIVRDVKWRCRWR